MYLEWIVNKKWMASVVLVASLSFVTACSASDDPAASPSASGSVSAAPEAGAEAEGPQPDVSGVPDVVATVNGEEITKADFVRIYEGQFQQVLEQAKMSGQDVDQKQLRKQTAEGLVDTELLIQHAAAKNIHATAEDLESALTDIAESLDTDRAGFLASMATTGLDEKAVLTQIRTQLEVERMLAKELGTFSPSEKELKAAYDSMVKEQKAKDGEVPALADIKTELSQQLKIQKEAVAVKSLVAKLRKDAKITLNM